MIHVTLPIGRAHTECAEGDITTSVVAQSAPEVKYERMPQYRLDELRDSHRCMTHLWHTPENASRDELLHALEAERAALDALRPSLPPTQAMYDTLMEAALALAKLLIGYSCPLHEDEYRCRALCCDENATCARRVVDAEIERVER